MHCYIWLKLGKLGIYFVTCCLLSSSPIKECLRNRACTKTCTRTRYYLPHFELDHTHLPDFTRMLHVAHGRCVGEIAGNSTGVISTGLLFPLSLAEKHVVGYAAAFVVWDVVNILVFGFDALGSMWVFRMDFVVV